VGLLVVESETCLNLGSCFLTERTGGQMLTWQVIFSETSVAAV
jgi:hypothetical protein